jgi:hypothetical protein
MSERPARLWKSMSPEQRLTAADAFWREDSNDIQLQHMDAIATMARRLNFRTKSVQALPVERRAKLLAQLSDVSDAVATRALIAYHFTARRDLMGAFLDALGIAHENGVINDENVPAPKKEQLATAIETLRSKFPDRDVDLYLHTLVALDGDTWAELDSAMGTAKAS